MIAFLPRRDFQLFQGSLVQVEVKMLASNMQQFNIIQLQVKYISIELWPKPEFYSFILTYIFHQHFRATSVATVSTSADGPALQFTSAALPRTYLLLK